MIKKGTGKTLKMMQSVNNKIFKTILRHRRKPSKHKLKTLGYVDVNGCLGLHAGVPSGAGQF